MCNCTIARRDLRGHDWDGEPIYETNRYPDTRDIDLHRYKCNQCGEIGYYSGAARKYYEEGVKTSGITGLEN